MIKISSGFALTAITFLLNVWLCQKSHNNSWKNYFPLMLPGFDSTIGNNFVRIFTFSWMQISHVSFPFSEYTIMAKQCKILSIIRSGHVKTFESWESEILLQFIYTLLILEILIHLNKFMKVNDITIIQGFRFWNDLMRDIHTFWIQIIRLWMFSWMEIVLYCYMGRF